MSVRTKSAAPERSTSESAICVTTNADDQKRWAGCSDWTCPEPDCFIAGSRSTRVARRAGARPKSTAVAIDTTAANASV